MEEIKTAERPKRELAKGQITLSDAIRLTNSDECTFDVHYRTLCKDNYKMTFTFSDAVKYQPNLTVEEFINDSIGINYSSFWLLLWANEDDKSVSKMLQIVDDHTHEPL